MLFILRECSDTDIIYGILVFNSEKVTEKEIQDEIGRLKDKFNDTEDVPSWTIEDDLLPRLKEKFSFDYYDYNMEIGELTC